MKTCRQWLCCPMELLLEEYSAHPVWEEGVGCLSMYTCLCQVSRVHMVGPRADSELNRLSSAYIHLIPSEIIYRLCKWLLF